MHSIVIYKICMFETFFLIQQKRFKLIWSYILKDTEFLVMEVLFNYRLYPQNAILWGRLLNIQEYIFF